MIFLILLSVFLTAILSISGGIFLLLGNNKIVKTMQKIGPYIACIVLLYAVFGDIIPEILEENELEISTLIILVAIGFISALLIGFFMGRFHHHNDIHQHENHKKSEIEIHGDKAIKSKTQAYTMLLVDSVHAVADGIVLGTSFIVSPSTGISTCLATIAHEIPQEIGDFEICRQANFSNKKIIKYQAISSFIIVPVAIISYFIGESLLSALPSVLAVVAGFLLYIAFGEFVCITESFRIENK